MVRKLKYPKDLTGERFGRLTVVGDSDKKVKDKNVQYHNCICDCGESKTASRGHLLRGAVQSCGCFRKDFMREKEFKHGEAGSRIYNIWNGMLGRCYSKRHTSYIRYGEVGISVCDEWSCRKNGYLAFKNWALNNAYTEILTLDRIDSTGNYKPSNCRWATPLEQSNNTKANIKNTVNGIEFTSISSLARHFNMSDSVLRERYKFGVRGDLLIYPSKTKNNMLLSIQNGEESLDKIMEFES